MNVLGGCAPGRLVICQRGTRLVTKLGVAMEEDVGIDTLADRLPAEIGDDGATVTWDFITAWAHHRAVPED